MDGCSRVDTRSERRNEGIRRRELFFVADLPWRLRFFMRGAPDKGAGAKMGH